MGPVHLHEVHLPDGSRSSTGVLLEEDRDVPREELVRGYEIRTDEYVVVDKKEVYAAAGERTRVIESSTSSTP